MINCISIGQRIVHGQGGEQILERAYSSIPLFERGMMFPVTVSALDSKTKDLKTLAIKSKTVLALLEPVPCLKLPPVNEQAKKSKNGHLQGIG